MANTSNIANYQTYIQDATTYWQNSSIYSLFETQINTDLNNLNTALTNYVNGLSGLNSNFNSILPNLKGYIMVKYNLYQENTPNINVNTIIPLDLTQQFNYYTQTLPDYTTFFVEINSTSLNDTIILNLITGVNVYLSQDTSNIANIRTNAISALSSAAASLSDVQSKPLNINFKYFILNYMNGKTIFSTFNWTITGIYP